MPQLRYLQVDVFAERAGGGNPLGVVFGADTWSDADMQRFAAWTNLVETTFVLAPARSEASYRLRIFTPAKEIAFAGHPTIGSAHAALEVGHVVARDGLLVQECGAGLLPIRVEGEDTARRLYVQAPAARVLRTGAHDTRLARVLEGIAPGQLPPAFVEGGRRWWVAEFATESALRAWQPDHAAIGTLARADDCLGLCVFARASRANEIDARAKAAKANGYDLVVRAFPAGVGIIEDPASGAANGLIAAYIAQGEPAGTLARGYRVSQGREIGHDATIDVRIDDARGDAGPAVWVGGRSHTIIDGAIQQRIGSK
ncbi:MAG: PhzF family phenazine biosynthesis protein [Gammaproteobacteria bacterium]|nr:MAG: PhzF family phenazine biosynthesis protein [Gammaproteobacteria bacterium]